MIERAVRRYFLRRYPDRESILSRWFRAGELERRMAIAPWLASVTGTVLDAGCGDGALLTSVLPGRVEAAWLVDISPAALARARERFAGTASHVHSIAGDLDEVDLPEVDVVVACGVTDYHQDWTRLIARLRRAARDTVIVDFPRAHTAHGTVRYWWLRSHGVALRTATEREVRAVCDPMELATTRLHWIARIPGAARA